MTLLTLKDVIEQYKLSERKATQLVRHSGALLPRSKGQKYIIVKEKFDKYLLTECI